MVVVVVLLMVFVVVVEKMAILKVMVSGWVSMHQVKSGLWVVVLGRRHWHLATKIKKKKAYARSKKHGHRIHNHHTTE